MDNNDDTASVTVTTTLTVAEAAAAATEAAATTAASTTTTTATVAAPATATVTKQPPVALATITAATDLYQICRLCLNTLDADEGELVFNNQVPSLPEKIYRVFGVSGARTNNDNTFPLIIVFSYIRLTAGTARLISIYYCLWR